MSQLQPSKTITWPEEARRLRLDALMLWWPYAEGSLRATIEALIEEASQEAWDDNNEAHLLACAAATWPARVATRLYAQAEPDELWKRLIPRCLPTTQVLLLRLAEQEGTTSYQQLLTSPQADWALHESERLELQLLMPQLYALLWQEKHAEMTEQLAQASAVREEKRALFADFLVDKAALSVFDHAMMYGEDLV